MYRILTGDRDTLEQQMNELAREGWRLVAFEISEPVKYAVMERKHAQPKPPTVRIQEAEMPFMGRT